MASEVLLQRTVMFLPGLTDCVDLDASWVETKIEPIVEGSNPITEGAFTVTLVALNEDDEWLSFTWTSSPSTLVSVVIVKAGNGSNVYTYSPEVTSDTDPLLTVGSNAVSHISFCVDLSLPVELTSFETVLDGRNALLTWETASETNNAGFDVQHRYVDDATAAFEAITFVEGHGTTEQPQTYSYRIDDLAPGRHAFRLKQIDFDGTFEYSPELEVIVEMVERFVIEPAYPNPFNSGTQFRFAVQREQQVRVDLYDMLGRRVKVLYEGQPPAGQMHTVRIDGSTLPSGLYVVYMLGKTFAGTQQVMLLK